MGLAEVETQIVTLAREIVDLQAVYDYPVFDLGRKLPALLVLYDGVAQEPGPAKATDTEWAWEFTLYLPAEGRKLETVWDEVKDLAVSVLDKFRANPGLNETAWTSIIESGEPVIDIPADPKAKPKWVGHSFRLIARLEEV